MGRVDLVSSIRIHVQIIKNKLIRRETDIIENQAKHN